MHFMLEDFPRSLQEVFGSLLPKETSGIILGRLLEDSQKTLERLSEDSRKTLGRLLGKSSNAFYARRLPTKSSESLSKSSAQSGTKK
ncbi:hypothetical protein F2Q69_00036483 [Brassica cretica]|uniref:Uncharacterized protein n=1 Tax=Brassica cretica TaxID=69181 RepID=A0A8S9SKG7_BRACR|nr:hypothetical protein F2Q69_00036483 [Brassica cretica]